MEEEREEGQFRSWRKGKRRVERKREWMQERREWRVSLLSDEDTPLSIGTSDNEGRRESARKCSNSIADSNFPSQFNQ